METEVAVSALVTDLQWQLDQFGPRGIKSPSGRTYSPAHFKRGLRDAVDDGGLAVVEFVRTFLYKPPTEGFKKLQKADSLDLASEALVLDEDRPYSHLFTEADRAAARERLGPHLESINARREEQRARIDAQRRKLRAAGLPRRSELDAQLRRRRGF